MSNLVWQPSAPLEFRGNWGVGETEQLVQGHTQLIRSSEAIVHICRPSEHWLFSTMHRREAGPSFYSEPKLLLSNRCSCLSKPRNRQGPEELPRVSNRETETDVPVVSMKTLTLQRRGSGPDPGLWIQITHAVSQKISRITKSSNLGDWAGRRKVVVLTRMKESRRTMRFQRWGKRTVREKEHPVNYGSTG